MNDSDIEDELDPRKRGLGRGLSALFDDDEDDDIIAVGVEDGTSTALQRRALGVEQLVPGAFQPRLQFDDSSIEQLAESISTHGILQPILVRPKSNETDVYEIIAGERRWRAAQKARLHEVPVIIQEMADQAAMEIALIENLQREDLNPLDEALGYKRLMAEYRHTQEELAVAVSKSRSHIANMVRLLHLPDVIQAMVRDGKLSSGHARALITAENPIDLAKKVVAQGLSVRQVEALVAEMSGKSSDKKKSKKSIKDPDTVALEQEVSNVLGMKVAIDTKKNGGGSLKVNYKSLDQLDEILHKLSQNSNRGGFDI